MSQRPSNEENSIDGETIDLKSCNTEKYSKKVNGKEDITDMNTNGKKVIINRVLDVVPRTINFAYLIKNHKQQKIFAATSTLYTKKEEDLETCFEPSLTSVVKNFDANKIGEDICNICIEMKKKIYKCEKNLKRIEDEVDKIYQVIKTDCGYNYKKGKLQQVYEFFVPKQEQNDGDVCNKLTKILKHIQSVHKDFNEQEIVLKEKTNKVVELENQNSIIKTKINELQDDIEIKTLENKHKQENYEKHVKYLLKTHNDEIDSHRQVIITLKSTFEEECSKNKKLQKEIELLRKESSTKIAVLESLNNQLETDWKSAKKNLDTAQFNLLQETKVKQRFQIKLKELKQFMFNNGVDLLNEKEMFQGDLSKILKVKDSFRNKISINYIESEMQSQFITKTNAVIDNIMEDVQVYEKEIDTFRGNYESKKYLHIREMLIRRLTELDAIESQNNDSIQTKRKSCISYVKELQSRLNDKAKSTMLLD